MRGVARGTMVGGGGMAKCSILGAFSGPVAFLCWDEHLYASSLGTLSGVGVGFPLPISIIKSPYEWRKRGISVFWFAHGSSPPGPLRVKYLHYVFVYAHKSFLCMRRGLFVYASGLFVYATAYLAYTKRWDEIGQMHRKLLCAYTKT